MFFLSKLVAEIIFVILTVSFSQVTETLFDHNSLGNILGNIPSFKDYNLRSLYDCCCFIIIISLVINVSFVFKLDF